jgi:chromodomain-helicase-DNA-binding protein 4
MSSSRHVSDSEADSEESSPVDLVRTPEPEPEDESADRSPPRSVLSHRFRASPSRHDQTDRERSSVAVLVPPPARPWEYQPFQGDTTVDTVLEGIEDSDGVYRYKIEYEDGRQEEVSRISAPFVLSFAYSWARRKAYEVRFAICFGYLVGFARNSN